MIPGLKGLIPFLSLCGTYKATTITVIIIRGVKGGAGGMLLSSLRGASLSHTLKISNLEQNENNLKEIGDNLKDTVNHLGILMIRFCSLMTMNLVSANMTQVVCSNPNGGHLPVILIINILLYKSKNVHTVSEVYPILKNITPGQKLCLETRSAPLPHVISLFCYYRSCL